MTQEELKGFIMLRKQKEQTDSFQNTIHYYRNISHDDLMSQISRWDIKMGREVYIYPYGNPSSDADIVNDIEIAYLKSGGMKDRMNYPIPWDEIKQNLRILAPIL